MVLVPEAEALVGRWRRDWDPSAAVGVPAHFTVLYPFLEPAAITAGVHAELGDLFARHAAFAYELTEVRRFEPRVVYLAPDPDAPFRSLTEAVTGRWPDHPPYGGIHDDVIPHLTVADVDDPTRAEALAAEIAIGTEMALPIAAQAEEVALLVERDGRWEEESRYPLSR